MIAVGQLREGRPAPEFSGAPLGLYYVVEKLGPGNGIFTWRYLVISEDFDMDDREGQLCDATAGWLESWTVEL